MCASANSLIGPNFKPMFTCTDAIVHQFHAVNAWHRNCYLSTEFCDFWLQSMAFYIDNLFQVASVDSMQNFLPFSIGFSFYFCTISVSLHSFSICLDAYCLYHQSALVTFAFVIINDYWIRKKGQLSELITSLH